MIPSALALLAVLVSIGWETPASANPLEKGWWIVIGAFPLEPWERQRTDFERMRVAAARCRLPIFNDFSGKFRGWSPGYNVFVVGAFASRAAADNKLRAVRPCFGDAYVRFGEHLGE